MHHHVLAGDFNEVPSTSQIIVNTIVTMIPVVDQLGDGRDVVANLKKLLWDRRWNEWAVWLSVFLCLIGLIPTLGSLAKGLVKVALYRAPKLADLLAVFNFFKKGNGVRWLREFTHKLPTEHATAAANQLTALLDRAASYVREARQGWFTPRYLTQTIDRLLARIREVKALAPQKLREVANDVAGKITQALNRGLSRVLPGRFKSKVTIRQKAEPPPANRGNGSPNERSLSAEERRRIGREKQRLEALRERRRNAEAQGRQSAPSRQ